MVHCSEIFIWATMLKYSWILEMQTDLQIPARRLEVILINKKKYRRLRSFSGPQCENKRKRKYRHITGSC